MFRRLVDSNLEDKSGIHLSLAPYKFHKLNHKLYIFFLAPKLSIPLDIFQGIHDLQYFRSMAMDKKASIVVHKLQVLIHHHLNYSLLSRFVMRITQIKVLDTTLNMCLHEEIYLNGKWYIDLLCSHKFCMTNLYS
jgi:hypothetical protein